MPDATQSNSTTPTPAPAGAVNGRDSAGRFGLGNRGGLPGRSGPPGNRHAAKHLIYAGGSLPPGASYVRKLRDRLVQALRDAVFAKHGEVDLVAAATIQSIGRHETVALLAQRWLRQRADKMTDADRLTYAKAIADASDKRDRAIRSLDLGRDAGSVWDAIYSNTPPDAPAAPESPVAHDHGQPDQTPTLPANASDGTLVRQEGDAAT